MNVARTSNRRIRGFSLVELVIVIVIIGIIAAIAIPRVSRGARGAGESALRSDLATLRNAIELYASEHNSVFPGTKPDGSTGDNATFSDQLLKYSDAAGNTADAKNTATGITLGPYLRKQIPPLPVGSAATNRGQSTVKLGDPLPTPDATTAWLYDNKTGELAANTAATDTDDAGKKYSDY